MKVVCMVQSLCSWPTCGSFRVLPRNCPRLRRRGASPSYSPGNSRKRDENILAKWLGFPHLQDTLDGPGRPKSLPQIG
jgi:hypothetical protein